MSKFLYPIYKLKIDNYKKWWLYHKKAGGGGILSDIVEGFSLTLQNSLARKFKIFDVEGHSEQESTSIADGDEYDSPSPEHEQPIKSAGENVNLFDGEYENAYTQGSSPYKYASDNNIRSAILKVDPNTTYTISKELSNRFRISQYTEEPVVNTSYATSYIQAGDDKTEYTLTTSSTTQYLVIQVTNESQENVKMKVEEGSIASGYSPFGMGSITEKIVNGNWFDGEIELGSVYNGNKISSSSNYRSVNFIPVKANTNYSFSINGNLNKVIMNYYDNNKTWLGSSNPDGYQVLNGLFTTPDNTKYILFRSFANDFELFGNGNIQIELGSTATDYVPHEEQTYSIYTQQPFRSIGNVRDVFFKNTVDSPYYDENLILNGWYERHKIGQVVLTGTENWQGPYNTVNNTVKYHISQSMFKLDIGLCNYFTLSNYANRSTDGVPHFYVGGDTLQLRVPATIASDTTSLKNWISQLYANEKPIYVNGELKEPTLLPCTQSQIDILENIPSTFAGQTNVFSEDEVKAYLRVQYYKEA